MSNPHGRVAVATGGAKGIGQAISVETRGAGAAGGGEYANDAEAADAVVAEIVSGGGHAVSIRGDQSNPADVDRLFAETIEALGPVDLLVNNAGALSFRAIEEVTEADFHRLYKTNVLGPILTTQRFVSQAPSARG